MRFSLDARRPEADIRRDVPLNDERSPFIARTVRGSALWRIDRWMWKELEIKRPPVAHVSAVLRGWSIEGLEDPFESDGPCGGRRSHTADLHGFQMDESLAGSAQLRAEFYHQGPHLLAKPRHERLASSRQSIQTDCRSADHVRHELGARRRIFGSHREVLCTEESEP